MKLKNIYILVLAEISEPQEAEGACASKMMQEVALASDADSYDSYDEHYDRPKERWAPLGAPQEEPEADVIVPSTRFIYLYLFYMFQAHPF